MLVSGSTGLPGLGLPFGNLLRRKKIYLDWKKIADNRFSAEIDFGILNLEIIRITNGIQIGSSLDLKAKLPENVIFTPLLIPECEPAKYRRKFKQFQRLYFVFHIISACQSDILQVYYQSKFVCVTEIIAQVSQKRLKRRGNGKSQSKKD